jgi:hypothetical protein
MNQGSITAPAAILEREVKASALNHPNSCTESMAVGALVEVLTRNENKIDAGKRS